jgi:hypothetical protein
MFAELCRGVLLNFRRARVADVVVGVAGGAGEGRSGLVGPVGCSSFRLFDPRSLAWLTGVVEPSARSWSGSLVVGARLSPSRVVAASSLGGGVVAGSASGGLLTLLGVRVESMCTRGEAAFTSVGAGFVSWV